MGSEANDVCGVPRGLAASANSILSVLFTLQLGDDKTLLTTMTAMVYNVPSTFESLGSPHCDSGYWVLGSPCERNPR